MRPLPATAAVLTALALLASGPGAAQEISGPKISNPELFEKSLEAASQALAFYGPYDNKAEARRVADLGYRVAEASGFHDFPFSFYLIDMPVPNAFALPGGQIFLTRGMLDLGLNDQALAGLLGHEIAHVVREHGVRMQKRATLLNVLSTAVLAGVVIAADGSRDPGGVPDPYGTSRRPGGDRVMGTAAAGMVVSELLLRSYNREYEDEADAEGQRMAAAAGFDPDGARQLMQLMRERLPETKEYGYWRTHPFFDQRVQAAEVRAAMITIQPQRPVEAYRRATQELLLGFEPGTHGRRARNRPPSEPGDEGAEPPTPEIARPPEMLKTAALRAWPTGPRADAIRLERLHRARDAEVARTELARDFGRLVEVYRDVAEDVETLDPEAPLLAELEREIASFERSRETLYPKALQVLEGGVYETRFLETFESNHPDAPEIPRVALELGDAYSRLGRQSDAVREYFAAWRADPASDPGRRARAGLKVLTPRLDRLGALQELAAQEEDAELRDLAAVRLAERATKFDELANGSDYLKRYPDGPHAEAVAARIDLLAENLYGEVVLYQTVGDHAQALDRIQRILTQAPLSPAAKRLRERAVFES